jgi:gliding motility-associated protein GldL
MNLNSLVRSKGYKNFMSKLYGLGASVVIVGALFKITHMKGADLMLWVGLMTEAIIFAFSAFEPPHVEPDWSLVYPELAGMYGPHESEIEIDSAKPTSVTEALDDMLKQANIEPALIASLATGLQNLSDTTQNMNKFTNAAVVSDEFVGNIKNASKTANVLTESYRKTAEALDVESQSSKEHVAQLHTISTTAANLTKVYNQAADSLKTEITARELLNENVVNAANSAGKLLEKYNKSAEVLSKAAEAIDFSIEDGQGYKEQLGKVTKNLGNLNAMYEMQLKYSETQITTSDAAMQAYNALLTKVTDSAAATSQLQKNLGALNTAFEAQISNTIKQAEHTEALQMTFEEFLTMMKRSIEQTNKYQQQAEQLSKNLAALNGVYGNMLSAMTVKL